MIEVDFLELFQQSGYKLAVAESCTGGLIGHRVTNIPGSSDFFMADIVAYSYEAKEKLLGVKRETLATYGAVSRETALEMAHGARLALDPLVPAEQTVAVAVTGIAGPGGAMPNKPVGLVWIAIETPTGNGAAHFIWGGDRVTNKNNSAEAAMQIVGDFLRNGNFPTG